MSDKLKSQLIEKIKNLENPTEIRGWIREKFGVKKTRANEIFNKAWDNSYPSVEIVEPTKVIEAEYGTLDELLMNNNIDLSVWEVSSFKISEWEDKRSIRAEFKKKVGEKRIETLIEFFEKESAKIAPKLFKYTKPIEDGKLLVLNLQDVHLSKKVTNAETNWGSYDTEIAKRYYKDAVDQLIAAAPVNEIEKVILVLGSDLLHFDTEQVTTTSGTRLESDSSWTTAYNEACGLITDVVEKLASQFKVEVMVVCGNHARLSEYALGSYIKAFFRAHENVSVNNNPLSRKYSTWGKNLIGFTHGDKVKVGDLPLIMMREQQEIISNYTALTYLTGHRHVDQLVDIKGVRVLTAPALCSPDNWHSQSGYVGNVQCSQGLVFSDWGLSQIIYSKPPQKVL